MVQNGALAANKKILGAVASVSFFFLLIQVFYGTRNIGKLVHEKKLRLRFSRTDTSAPKHSVLMIHYHKTGFALTRQLRKHILNETSLLKAFAKSQAEKCQEMTTPRGYVARDFDPATGCPAPLQMGDNCLQIINAPGLYCSEKEMVKVLLGDDIGCSSFDKNSFQCIRNGQFGGKQREAKIIHFVRDPYTMALSNYFYHSQLPPPEKWTRVHNPCNPKYTGLHNDTTLKDLLFPTLSSSTDFVLSKDDFDKVTRLCQSLYRTDPSTKIDYYDGHLQKLDQFNGLRLSTAQLMIRGVGEGFESRHTPRILAGGDILRMANNIIKLRDMELFLSKVASRDNDISFNLTTVSMDSFIEDPFNFTMKYEKILLGDNRQSVDEEALREIAQKMESKYEERKSSGSRHVTSATGKDEKELLKGLLKRDSVLGPILDRIEILVDNALDETNNMM